MSAREETVHPAQPQRTPPRMQRMLRKRKTIWKTRQDETRQDKTGETQHTTSRATNRTRRTEHDSTGQRSPPRMHRMLTMEDKTRQDKTRRMKHDTGHLAQPQRWPPRMCAAKQGTLRLRTAKHGTLHLAQPQITAVDAANASEVQDYGRQDKR